MKSIKAKDCWEADFVRPSEFLASAEERAILIGKRLTANRQELERRTNKTAVEDALKLSETVASLAAFGRRCDAARASEIAWRVQILLNLLSD